MPVGEPAPLVRTHRRHLRRDRVTTGRGPWAYTLFGVLLFGAGVALGTQIDGRGVAVGTQIIDGSPPWLLGAILFMGLFTIAEGYFLIGRVQRLMDHAEQLQGAGARLLALIPGKSAPTSDGSGEQPHRRWHKLRNLPEQQRPDAPPADGVAAEHQPDPRASHRNLASIPAPAGPATVPTPMVAGLPTLPVSQWAQLDTEAKARRDREQAEYAAQQEQEMAAFRAKLDHIATDTDRDTR